MEPRISLGTLGVKDLARAMRFYRDGLGGPLSSTGGGTILKPGVEAPGSGYSGYFADPDGCPWEVAWNPQFPLRKDGAVTLPE